MCQTVKVHRLSIQQRLELLQHEKLALVLPDLHSDLLTLKGSRDLVYEVRSSPVAIDNALQPKQPEFVESQSLSSQNLQTSGLLIQLASTRYLPGI